MNDRIFKYILAPDKTCWGKWFLPADCLNESAASGRHISEFTFGGLYQEIEPPRRKDYANGKDFSAAFDAHSKECDADEVQMLFTATNILFLRPYPEWVPKT